MTAVHASTDRSAALRWLAYAAVALATLVGLFAMHGLAMAMPAAMPMPGSSVPSSHIGATAASMEIRASNAPATVRMGAASGMGEVAGSAWVTGSPTAGVHGGCDAEHNGCLATLRAQPHPHSPAAVALASAPGRPAELFSHLGRCALFGHGPPPRPCLIELCISRT